MSERIPTSDLIATARLVAPDSLHPTLLTDLADRLDELTRVDNPCPECDENVIPLQRGSDLWACKNNHVQLRP